MRKALKCKNELFHTLIQQLQSEAHMIYLGLLCTSTEIKVGSIPMRLR